MFDSVGLVETARKAAGVDVRGCSDDDLLDGVTALEAARRALEVAECAFVAELDARGVCDRRFGHRTRDWLAAEHGIERREASRWCRVGRGLRSLSVAADALADGRVSLEHARVLIDASNPRVAHVLEAAQAELVALAATMRFEDWARHVRALVDLADTDGGHDPRPERRSLTWGRGLDGELHGRFTLLGADAAAFEHLIDTATDRRFRQASKDRDAAPVDLPMPTRTQLRADALTELVRSGADTSDPAATTTDVTITIPHDHPALTGDPGPAVCCGDHTELTGTALDLALCDAAYTAVIVDGDGTPLAVGRTRRHATPTQRRALAVRDGGCAFPGCDAPPRWTDAHHVTPWQAGGTTDLHNLVLICRHHHGVIHRTGWTMTHTGHQHFDITTPTGRRLRAQRHGRPPDRT
jgi:hypothetical protein